MVALRRIVALDRGKRTVRNRVRQRALLGQDGNLAAGLDIGACTNIDVQRRIGGGAGCQGAHLHEAATGAIGLGVGIAGQDALDIDGSANPNIRSRHVAHINGYDRRGICQCDAAADIDDAAARRVQRTV